ncbi:MAG: hypothetical protein Q9222_004209 [Ikaeria aurantiellina]
MSDADDEIDSSESDYRTSEERSPPGIWASVVPPENLSGHEVGDSGTSALMNPERPHCPEPESHQMHVILQPPREARSGQVLEPPIVISLQIHDDLVARAGGFEATVMYMAFVSVVSPDGMVALAPPSATLLSGIFTDSIHQGRLTENEYDVGHFQFRDVIINEPGDYRLRFSLLQVPRPGSDQPDAARNVASVVTEIIRVYGDA